jgi:hypothetical protein
MELQAPDEEAMVRGAVADLDDRFATIDRSRIEGTVRRLVHEWCARSRVKSFVGIIAERHAREELEAATGEVASPSAAGNGRPPS